MILEIVNRVSDELKVFLECVEDTSLVVAPGSISDAYKRVYFSHEIV